MFNSRLRCGSTCGSGRVGVTLLIVKLPVIKTGALRAGEHHADTQGNEARPN